MRIGKVIKIGLLSVLVLSLFVVPPALYAFYSYYRSLEDQLTTRFSGKRWNLPSRVYSDTVTIYPGQSLKDLGFFDRLARLNYHRVDKVTTRGEYSYDEDHGRLAIFLHSFAYPYNHFGGELVEVRFDSADQKIVLMGDGVTQKPLYSIELEPELISGIYEGNWAQRRLVPLADIPPALVDAVLAAEDHRFYQHHGVDLVRIIKAGWVDMTSGRLRQGGSTLTQQLMKNFFLTSQRDWHRKATEALMAYIAERKFTKDEILENYLNDIYLGQRGQEGIYGVWEASQYYFSKDLADLTIGEMATIAGMISSPNRFNPLKHPDLARARRNEVLLAMLGEGYISKPAYDEAATQPMQAREVFTESNDAPYFNDYVRRELAARYPPEVLTGEGLRIFTTLDVHANGLAAIAIEKGLTDLEAKHASLRRKEEDDNLQACLVALEPQTGKIRAMVGGRDYRHSQFNRVTQSKRQPGSVFKPITYLAALDAGYSPTTPVEDAPFTWVYGDNLSWTPANYKKRYFGQVPLMFALGESLNAATSRLAYAVGLERVRAMASKLGFEDLPDYPSIVLGGVEVAPIEIARAYAILANEGFEVEPFAVSEVVDKDGKVIEGHQLKAEQVLAPDVAYEIDAMLQYVINHGTGAGARRLGFTRPAAGKTGTTNEEKDAWFAGFTPDLLAVVWTGFDKKEVIGLTGAQAALPMWVNFMKAATASRPRSEFLPPPAVAVAKVDKPTSAPAASPTAAAPAASLEAAVPDSGAQDPGDPND
ncbi:MAG TPA: PBP1A family penicillin-binding protein [Candidatus Binataceae bacterium]